MSDQFVTMVVVSSVISVVVWFVLDKMRGVPTGEQKLIADPSGSPRIELIAEAPGVFPDRMVGLRFLTRSGGHRLGLGTFKDEGTLAFVDATGLARLSVRMEEGNPRIIFWKHRDAPAIGGTRRIVLGLRQDGSHCLEFFNEAGESRLSLGIGDGGAAFIRMLDNDGKEIWRVPGEAPSSGIHPAEPAETPRTGERTSEQER